MVYRCITSLECIEQKVSFPFSASKDNMVQNQSEQLLKLLEPTFGSASELSKELGNAALEIAVTPLADITDYTAIRNAVWIMLEIKKALDKVAEQKK